MAEIALLPQDRELRAMRSSSGEDAGVDQLAGNVVVSEVLRAIGLVLLAPGIQRTQGPKRHRSRSRRSSLGYDDSIRQNASFSKIKNCPIGDHL